MTTVHSTIPAHRRPGGRPHPTDTGVAPANLAPTDPHPPAADDPGPQADTHVQVNGELANRLMRSARWQQ